MATICAVSFEQATLAVKPVLSALLRTLRAHTLPTGKWYEALLLLRGRCGAGMPGRDRRSLKPDLPAMAVRARRPFRREATSLRHDTMVRCAVGSAPMARSSQVGSPEAPSEARLTVALRRRRRSSSAGSAGEHRPREASGSSWTGRPPYAARTRRRPRSGRR